MISRWLFVVAAALSASPLAAETRPNFIVINIDDLGYADIAPFGSKLNRTPNLDQMAEEGRKLTCFYAAPVISDDASDARNTTGPTSSSGSPLRPMGVAA